MAPDETGARLRLHPFHAPVIQSILPAENPQMLTAESQSVKDFITLQKKDKGGSCRLMMVVYLKML